MTARRAPRRAEGEAGVTLVEVLVGTALMALVMVLFTSGVLTVHQATRRSEQIAAAQAGISRTFARLDTELRYAQVARVRPIAGVPTDALEYLSGVGGARWCYRLWLADGQLHRRVWSDPAAPPAYPSPAPDALAHPIVDNVAAVPRTTGPDADGLDVEQVFAIDDGGADGVRVVTVRLTDPRADRAAHQEFPLPNTADGTAGLTMDDCEDWNEVEP